MTEMKGRNKIRRRYEMDKTLLFYELILEKKKQMKIFGESTLKEEVRNFIDNSAESDYTYINRPDNVIIEIVSIKSHYIFGSYGRLSNIDGSELIRSRNKDDYSSEYLEDLIETYTYFLLDLETNQIVLLDNYKCTGFNTYFSKFLGDKFNLNNYFDNISVIIKKEDNIKESLFKPNNIKKINIQYTSDQLVENKFLLTKELYKIKNSIIKNAKITLNLESTIENSKLKQLVSKDQKISQNFSKFDIETTDGLINLVERKITKKIFTRIDEDKLNDLIVIEELLLDNLVTED